MSTIKGFLGFLAIATAISPVSLSALPDIQTGSSSPAQITVVRKPGQEDGVAQMVIKGKVQKITPHAVQAWAVRGDQGALILVLEKNRARPKQYVLRYYDLDSGRRRPLGLVPFKSAVLKESTNLDQQWSFALTGPDPATGQPVTIVGDDRAIPGVVPGAYEPSFSADKMSYTALPSHDRRTLEIGALLGTGLNGIYTLPQSSPVTPQYLQIFPNGTAMTVTNDGAIHQGSWHTDGTTLELNVGDTKLNIPQASLQRVKGVPAGTRFSVRLLQPLSSRSAKEGMTIEAVSITPNVIDRELLVPAGSSIEGTIIKANGVGWGFKHETASLTIDWTRATLSDGRKLPISARTVQVENAQEKVDANGKIQGIRSTGTPGHSVENGVLAFAGIDPIAYIFAASSGSAVLGFAEPEILYNSGTELILEYVRPLFTSQSYPPSVLPSATTPGSVKQLQDFVKTVSFRTRTKVSNKASDLTNLIFVGSPDGLRRAFTAAGWLPTDDLNSTSTFRTLKTLSGNQIYTEAPMSVLVLDEREPLIALSKTTNTFASRHHIRVFPTEEKWQTTTTVLTASSTQDIGIAFSRKHKTFVHVIDQHIDNERSKVVNDLEFTGCVESVDMVPRPWLPTDAYNSTGDRLLTDREVAVLHISDCSDPKTTPGTIARPPDRFERITRDTSLTIRNDLYRGNLIYQGIAGGLAVRKYFRSSSELPEDYGAWRKTDASGANYNLSGSSSPVLQRRAPRSTLETSPKDLAEMAKIKESHKWDPPHYEFAIEGGNLFFRGVQSLSAEDIQLVSSDVGKPDYELILSDVVNSGWSAGGTVTVNSWRHFSSEFSYFRQQGKYELDALTFTGHPNDQNEDVNLDVQRVGLTTRQAEYNLLAQVRPPTSRWRPYIAAGPVFQLITLSNSPLKKPAGPFTLGLKNIGLIKAAFDFGNTPALDGGGVFEFGLQYGAGLKYRVTPHIIVRADYRETWSKNPDLIKGSYLGYESPDVDGSYTTDVLSIKPASKFFQDRFTLGVAFAF